MKQDITKANSATPFGTSTMYSVLTMWVLEITSAQFTSQNWNLRTLPHHLLKFVISTLISRLAKTHLSLSASTIRERTLHFGLSTFLIWTATFPPIQLMVFLYLNWWDMLEFAPPKLTSSIDSVVFHFGFETNLLQKLFNKLTSRHGLIVEKYGAALRGMRLAIQPWIAPLYPYTTYLLHCVVFQLYPSTCACKILFWAHSLFVYLFNRRVHFVLFLTF